MALLRHHSMDMLSVSLSMITQKFQARFLKKQFKVIIPCSQYANINLNPSP